MIKVIISVILLCSFTANAQEEFLSDSAIRLIFKDMLYQNDELGKKKTAKTSAYSDPLLAKSNYNYAGGHYILNDTSTYTWSGLRTSRETRNPTSMVIADSFDTNIYRSAIYNYGNRSLNSFDTDGNIKENILQRWDSIKTVWVNVSRKSNDFTAMLITKSVFQNWDTLAATWKNESQQLNNYTGTDLTENIVQSWDESSSAWVNNVQTQTTFSAGLPIERIAYKWNSGVWQYTNRITSSYSGTVLANVFSESWDLTELKWINSYKNSYTYIGGDRSSIISYSWNRIEGKWIGVINFKFNYSGGSMTDHILMLWDLSTDNWINSSKVLYAYTGADLVETIAQNWDTSSKKWYDFNKTNYAYVAGNVSEMIGARWISAAWEYSSKVVYTYDVDNKLTKVYNYEWVGGSWQPRSNFSKTLYYYITTAGVETLNTKLTHAILYPNPATNPQVYIDFFTEKSEPTEIILSNIIGQRLFYTKEKASIGNHSVMIPVASLNPGLYFVSIYSKGQLVSTLKLTK